MISLLQPIYLLAFLGLFVPIAIHLWSKKEGKVLKIGTVRWMQKKASSKVSKIRFHDWWLFLLRCAIISLVVLVLAQIVIKRSSEKESLNWVLIDPLIDLTTNDIKQLTDTLKGAGFEVRALDYGFKKIGTDERIAPKDNIYNTWAILKTAELLEDQPDSILVISKGYIKNFYGTKPPFSIPHDYLIIPDQDSKPFIYEARFLNDDSLLAKIGKSHSNYTPVEDIVVNLKNPILSVLTESHPTISLNVRADSLEVKKGKEALEVRAINTTDSLQVLILYNEGSKKDLKYWKAGLRALSQHQKIPLLLEATNTDEAEDDSLSNRVFDWLVVLEKDGSYDEEKSVQKVFITAVSNDSLDGNWFTLIEKGDKEIYSINNSLTDAESKIQSFPTALLEVFYTDYDSVLWLNDKRTIAFEQLDLSIRGDVIKEESKRKVSYQKADSFMWIATLILLLLERFISYKRDLS